MSAASLDEGQYSAASIDHYEAIFGRDFVSPGGEPMARELINRLDLPPGARVLDVGCGLGGASFLMARGFGLRVDGIDLSANMIERAGKRMDELSLSDSVSLSLGDCLDLEAREIYDAVYSRDVFLHIHDKTRLFQVLRRAMKSGGTLLFTDYCCGDRPWQPAFESYVAERGYCLHTVTEYRELLEISGFRVIEAADWTGRFISLLESEARRIADCGLDVGTTRALQDSWAGKIGRARQGDHRWGLFIAVR